MHKSARNIAYSACLAVCTTDYVRMCRLSIERKEYRKKYIIQRTCLHINSSQFPHAKKAFLG